jgi:alcohol dehydrogenase (cytochrome c)
MIALNGNTGKMLWYQQVTPHDLRDYDFQDSPIITTQRVDGVKTEIVIGAGKSGKVIGFRADDGKRLWTLNIGMHNSNEYGPFPSKPVLFCPGSLGGVLTPMAETGDTLYVPWIDLCLKGDDSGPTGAGSYEGGGLAAVNATTGQIVWKHIFNSLDSGAATIAGNVVFTSTFNGKIYALAATTGAVLWSAQAPAGINSFPAVTKDMLIIGAGAPVASGKHATDEIIAYSLGGK